MKQTGIVLTIVGTIFAMFGELMHGGPFTRFNPQVFMYIGVISFVLGVILILVSHKNGQGELDIKHGGIIAAAVGCICGIAGYIMYDDPGFGIAYVLGFARPIPQILIGIGVAGLVIGIIILLSVKTSFNVTIEKKGDQSTEE